MGSIFRRIVSVNYPGTTPDIARTYDANGNLASVTRGTSAWRYQYNAIDALTQELLVVDGRSYQYDYGYTSEGYLDTATMPAAGAVSFSPNGLGQPTGLSVGATVLASGASYFANGQMQALTLGNGFTYAATQNARQLIERATTSAGATAAYDASYTYDAHLPRLVAIADNAAGGDYARGLSYDGLGRLLSASGPWGQGSFTYDVIGNLRGQVLGTRTIAIDYDATNRVSQFSDSASAGGAAQAVSHDGRGNMVTRGALALVYDEANQPVSVSGAASGTYMYDGHLKRVRQTFGGATTYSVYSLRTGAISVIDNATSGEAMALLALGPVSVRWRGDGSAEYVHLDHLGSSAAASNAAGVVTWRESYLPFGEGRLSPAANDNRPGFTGHVDDAATGLTYMQARYFDPVLGRFLQTDPIGYADQLNLYAYVGNDPVNRTDPTGQQSCNDNPSCPGGRAAREARPAGEPRAAVMAFVPEAGRSTPPAEQNTLQSTGDVLGGMATARSGQELATSGALRALGHNAAAELSERALGPMGYGLEVAGESARVAGDIEAGVDPDVAVRGAIGRVGTTGYVTLMGTAVGTGTLGPGFGTALGTAAGLFSELSGLSERGGEVFGQMEERGPNSFDCGQTLGGC